MSATDSSLTSERAARPRGGARAWAIWLGALVAATALMHAVRARLDKAHVALVFLLLVLGGSAAAGRRVGITLALLAFLAFNYFFLPPYGTLTIADPLDWLVLVTFLVTGIVAAHLLERQRQEAEIARRRAEEIDRLAMLGAETLKAPRAEQALHAIEAVIRDALGAERCEIVTVATRAGGTAATTGDIVDYVAQRGETAIEHADGTIAVVGGGTPESFRDLRGLTLSLGARGRVNGVLRLGWREPVTLGAEQRRVLAALSYYAALGAERVRLGAAEAEAEALRRADRLKDALLAAVSHDLRTPLTTIKGIAHEIAEGAMGERAAVIEAETDRLTIIVNDLLELSQLDAGALAVDTELNTVDDLVGAALQRTAGALHGRRVDVALPPGELLVGRFDFSHALRVVANLLENAAKYAPAGSPVEIRAWRADSQLCVAVEDRGPGVPEDERERVFEPFRRGSTVPDGVRGTGLGLAIARRLAEVQGGTLRYEPRPGGGSRFVLSLPAASGETPG